MIPLSNGQLNHPLITHHTVEKGHGRIEERDYWTAKLPEGLQSDGWAGLKTIAKVCSKRTIQGKTSIEQRYYIDSIPANNIQDMAKAIREHWQVKNKLHWRLDVSFNEDRWRSKQGNAAANMALLNKMALNLLKNETTAKVAVKNRRLMAGWNQNYLETVLTAFKN